jgi:hypothetical protein
LPTLNTTYIGTSPDENTYIYFSRLLKNESSLGYTEPLNEKYDTNIFLFRSAIYSDETKLVSSRGFLGINVINGVIWSLTGESYFINILIALLGLVFFYFLVKELFNQRIALVSLICASVLPLYAYWSPRIYADIPSLAFLLGSMLYLVKYSKNKQLKYIVLSAILFSISFWFRYIAGIYMAVFVVIYLAFPLKNAFTKRNLYAAGIYVAISAVLISPLLILNNQLYGGPFTTGMALNPNINVVEGSIIGRLMHNFGKYFLSLDLHYVVIYTMLGFFGIILLLKNGGRNKKLALFFICTFISINIYIANMVLWGESLPKADLSHSYMRYFMLHYLLLIPYSIAFLDEIKLPKLRGTIISLLMVLCIVITITLPSNPIQYREGMNDRVIARDFFLDVIPEDAIVFSRYYDKWISQDRKTAIYYYIVPAEERISRTADLIKEMLDDDLKVFFLKEDRNESTMEVMDYYYFNDYQQEFEEIGLSVNRVRDVIYQLVLEE